MAKLEMKKGEDTTKNAEETRKETSYGRGGHPNSRKNLEVNHFTSEHQPELNGRPKGSKDRKSLLAYWLEQSVTVKNEMRDKEGKYKGKIFHELPDEMRGTVYDNITLGIIRKAMLGDVRAFQEIQDSLHGKNPDKLEITLPPEIEAARALYEQMLEEGAKPNRAIRTAIETARTRGFELTESDIINAGTIG